MMKGDAVDNSTSANETWPAPDYDEDLWRGDGSLAKPYLTMEQSFGWWHLTGGWLEYCMDTGRDPDDRD